MNSKEASAQATRITTKRTRICVDTSPTSSNNSNITPTSRRKIPRLKSPATLVHPITTKKVSRKLPRDRVSQSKHRTVSRNASKDAATPKRSPHNALVDTTSPMSPVVTQNPTTSAEENCENFEPDTTNPNAVSSPLKSPMRSMLRQLQSDLSPKFLTPSPPSTISRCSRYGRTQKTKESFDLLDTNLALAVRRSLNDKPAASSASTDSPAPRQPRSRKRVACQSDDDDNYDDTLAVNVDLIRSPHANRSRYLSPIEKLIEINRARGSTDAATGNSPSLLGEHYVKAPKNVSRVSPHSLGRHINFDQQAFVPKAPPLDLDPKRELPFNKLVALAGTKKSINSPRRHNIPPPPLFSESEPLAKAAGSKPNSPLKEKSPKKTTLHIKSPKHLSEPNSASPGRVMRLSLLPMTTIGSPIKSPSTNSTQLPPVSRSPPRTPTIQSVPSPSPSPTRTITCPKTPIQPQPDLFKKPSPKSIGKQKAPLATSPKSTLPRSPPVGNTAECGVDFLMQYLVPHRTIKTYKNRRRLLSADLDTVLPPVTNGNDDTLSANQGQMEEAQEETVIDTIATAQMQPIETTLHCLPVNESVQVNLIQAIVDIQMDPHFGMLNSLSAPDNDVPIACKMELIDEPSDWPPAIDVVRIKTEPDEPTGALNKSFDGDNSPSVSSADSAKGSSIVDDDPVAGTTTTTTAETAADRWQVGMLAWARIGNYPYWPSLVCSSPAGTCFSFSAGKKPVQRIHVRFLADNGRRCWATASCMTPFHSIEDFENMKRELPPNLKSKDPRVRAFVVSEPNLILWHQAVVEAQMLATFPITKRVLVFENLLNDAVTPKNSLGTAKRHSTASQESFDSLFTEADRRITSTPSILPSSRRSSVQERQSIGADKFEPRPLISRSPTPESPMYEELSFTAKRQSDIHDTVNIQHFLLSMSANDHQTAASPVPEPPTDDVHSRLQLDDNIQAMDDENFRNFYQHTKAIYFGDGDESPNESHLKHLAHKMWMLKQLKVSQKKRRSSVRSVDHHRAVSAPKLPAKPRKSPGQLKKAAATSARRSARMSISSAKLRQSVDAKVGAEVGAEVEQPAQMSQSELLADKAAKRAQRAEEKEKRELLEMSKYFMKKMPKNILFRGLDRELVCRYCHTTGDLVKCHTSTCHEHVHPLCATHPEVAVERAKPKKGRKSKLPSNSPVPSAQHVTGDDVFGNAIEVVHPATVDLPATDHRPAYCPDCTVGHHQPVCYVCKTSDGGTLLRCTDKLCGRQFHVACMRYWPQNKINHQNDASLQLLCPCHVCHTCISDDPRGKHYHTSGSKLTKCVKCPATYHIDSCCIPAGSQLLTASQLICPRHRVDNRKPVNANWCFICSKGGQLVCCETCPTSFHAECLKVDISDSCYICEECETGRFPLYGEIVWAKMGSCRWWPAVTVPPAEIPATVLAVKREAHNFAIRFFGSRDYSWISRGFVFLYQEGDSDYTESGSGDMRPDRVYQKALVEASEFAKQLYAINEQHMNPDRERNLKPLPYIKIARNRPIAPVKLHEQNDEDGEKVCECRPSDDDPCGPHSMCMNRMLFFECDAALCRAGDRCQNQSFDRRMYPSMVERRIDGKGWGLVTLEFIPAGSFIIEYVGELINRKEFERRIQVMQQTKDEHYYFLTLSRELMIDAGPRGNSSRFINHSCEPNCETQCWQVKGNTRVGLFAQDDIPANTELTFNYNLECIGELKKKCQCGAKRCAGFIGAKYVHPHETSKKDKSKKKNRKSLPKVTSSFAKKKKSTTHTELADNEAKETTSTKDS